MALGNDTPMAFVATRDAASARAFYADVLDLPLIVDDEHAVVFMLAGGVMLRVQKAPPFTPHPFTQLGWQVDDIAARVDALVARGVVFERYPWFEQDERGVWTAPGGVARVAWFKDPDGDLLSLTQA